MAPPIVLLMHFQVQYFPKLAPEAAKAPDTIRAWPIQFLRDSAATTKDYWLLRQYSGHNKLESKHSINSVFNILSYPSQLHHLP